MVNLKNHYYIVILLVCIFSIVSYVSTISKGSIVSNVKIL